MASENIPTIANDPPVKPGDPIRIPAALWNDIKRMARAGQGGPGTIVDGTGVYGRPLPAEEFLVYKAAADELPDGTIEIRQVDSNGAMTGEIERVNVLP